MNKSWKALKQKHYGIINSIGGIEEFYKINEAGRIPRTKSMRCQENRTWGHENKIKN